MRTADAVREAGLSPRVRGNLIPRFRNADYRRSIPACAGEPCRSSRSPARRRVYPRVCGGTLVISISNRQITGLSPRVRGNHRLLLGGHDAARSIPACAGEPPRRSWTPAPPGVYPRVCGGTPGGKPVGKTPAGLSPRVRGNLSLPTLAWNDLRSIPACAGEPRVSRGRGRGVRSIPACAGEPLAAHPSME